MNSPLLSSCTYILLFFIVSQLHSFSLCSRFMLAHWASDAFIIIVEDPHICFVTGEQSRLCHWPGSRLWTNVLTLHLHVHICKIEMVPTCGWESAASCVALKKNLIPNKCSVDANVVIIIIIIILLLLFCTLTGLELIGTFLPQQNFGMCITTLKLHHSS